MRGSRGSSDIRLFDRKHSRLVRVPNRDIVASNPHRAIENEKYLQTRGAVRSRTAEFNVTAAERNAEPLTQIPCCMPGHVGCHGSAINGQTAFISLFF